MMNGEGDYRRLPNTTGLAWTRWPAVIALALLALWLGIVAIGLMAIGFAEYGFLFIGLSALVGIACAVLTRRGKDDARRPSGAFALLGACLAGLVWYSSREVDISPTWLGSLYVYSGLIFMTGALGTFTLRPRIAFLAIAASSPVAIVWVTILTSGFPIWLPTATSFTTGLVALHGSRVTSGGKARLKESLWR